VRDKKTETDRRKSPSPPSSEKTYISGETVSPIHALKGTKPDGQTDAHTVGGVGQRKKEPFPAGRHAGPSLNQMPSLLHD